MGRLALPIATVIGITSRRVVRFALTDHLRTELVADALANAVAACDPAPRGGPPLLEPAHYISDAYADLAGDCQVTLSVGRRAG